MKEIKECITELISLAQEQIKANPAVQQMILLETAKGNRYTCVNDGVMQGNYENEDSCIQMLADAEDAKVAYIVCMWNNGGVDVPSANFRKNLLAICSENEEAIFIMQGVEGFVCKKLKDV